MNRTAYTSGGTGDDVHTSASLVPPSTLPALIKIDQPLQVGYRSPIANTNQNNRTDPSTPESVSDPQRPLPCTTTNSSSSSSSSSDKMLSSPDSVPAHPQYRPTIINLAPPPNETTPLTTPIEQIPTPLVPPVESDRPERMRDWLVRMINSGRFPGLKWLDEEKMIFRVPWIHAKKRDYNQERDAALFREWAIHSGKYGDGSDVTTWKINFRCALNGLKDIVERRELEEQDCRVYQMLPSSGIGRRRKRRHVDYTTNIYSFSSSPDRDVRQRIELGGSPAGTPALTPTIPTLPLISATPLTTSTTLTTLTSSTGHPLQVLPIVPGTQFRLPFVASPTASQQAQLGIVRNFGRIIQTPMTPVTPMELNSDGSIHERDNMSQPHTPRTPMSPAAIHISQFSPKVLTPSHPSQLSLTTSTSVLPMNPVLRTGPVYCPPAEFLTNPNAITIRIMYGSITVHMKTLDCTPGVRIYYGPLHCRDVLPQDQEEKLFGPLDAHQIALSPRHPASLAKQIFNFTKRGLILEVGDQNIYATALCRAVVYHGCSPMKHSGVLQKEVQTKVFNYNNRFLPALKYHSEGHGTPPKPYVIFSLGQPWGMERAFSKNLVTVTVTYCKALNDLRVRNATIHDELLFEAQEAKDIKIISPTPGDLEAERFLNPGVEPQVSN